MQRNFRMSTLVCTIPDQTPIVKYEKHENIYIYQAQYRNLTIRIMVSEYYKNRVQFGKCRIRGYPVVKDFLEKKELLFFLLKIHKESESTRDYCSLSLNCTVDDIKHIRYHDNGEQYRDLTLGYQSPDGFVALPVRVKGALARKCFTLETGDNILANFILTNALPLKAHLNHFTLKEKRKEK